MMPGGEGEGVGVDDPRQVAGAAAEVGVDRRQGGDDDEGVEGDQQVGARGEQDGQPAVRLASGLDASRSGSGWHRVPLAGDGVSPAYERADGRYAANWAPRTAQFSAVRVVYLFSNRCRWSARGSRRDEGDDMDTDLLSLGARRRRGRVRRAGRAVPPRAAGALLPDPGVVPGRRGRAAGDAAVGLARSRRLRGALVGPHLALPHRDQPQPRRRPRRRPTGRADDHPRSTGSCRPSPPTTARCRGSRPTPTTSSTCPTRRPARRPWWSRTRRRPWRS